MDEASAGGFVGGGGEGHVRRVDHVLRGQLGERRIDRDGFAVGPENSERLPPFVQTSLRVDKRFTFKSWQLETYVDLLNIVRGVNPEFTLYNYDFSEFAYVRGLPFIPNIGIEAEFFP